MSCCACEDLGWDRRSFYESVLLCRDLVPGATVVGIRGDKILVVEDSRFFNNLVSTAVQGRIGADVVRAMSLAEAKEAVTGRADEFGLALVDLVLPDAGDGEAVDWLAEQNVPSIIFTGVFSADLRERLLVQNVIDYVVKDTPSSLDYLLDLVERLHRNRAVKVMIVDDSRLARRQAANLLRSYQFQVFEAESGARALRLLEEHPDIRLIVTDQHMPEMSGVEMVKRMRATHAQDRLAIIGLSSGGNSLLSAQFIKFGANDYLNKPFLPEEFFCRVMQNVRVLEMVDRLTDLATKDALTGIHNRRFLFEAGKTVFANAKREHLSLAVAMIDIDFFKKINDSFGHDGGDMVLKHVARLLRANCRQSDIVARMGGEEFTILAFNMDAAAVDGFFEQLRANIESETIIRAAKKIPVTVSIGVCHGLGDSMDGMLKLADDMLYRAKQNGRNRVELTTV